MKNFLYELKNIILYILSNKKYLQIISFLLFIISLYFFASYLNKAIYSNDLYSPMITEERKHLRNLETIIYKADYEIFNDTFNETENKNNSYLIANNTYDINNMNDTNNTYINESGLFENNISDNELNIMIKVRPLKKKCY